MAMFGDLKNLTSLLKESEEAENERSSRTNQAPGASGPTTVVVSTGKKVELAPTKKKDSIWDTEDIPSEDTLASQNDERSAPRYEFSYKQSVGTEDTILGMGEKTPLTQHCSHLVVKVHFPGATMKDLDLDVTPRRIKVSSKTHKLFTYLPVNVDEKNGSAKFDAKKEVLSVTLPIVEE